MVQNFKIDLFQNLLKERKFEFRWNEITLLHCYMHPYTYNLTLFILILFYFYNNLNIKAQLPLTTLNIPKLLTALKLIKLSYSNKNLNIIHKHCIYTLNTKVKHISNLFATFLILHTYNKNLVLTKITMILA